MKAIKNNNFKAVDFMRKVREELSDLYHTDKNQYFEEIKNAMEEFKAKQQKVQHKLNLNSCTTALFVKQVN